MSNVLSLPAPLQESVTVFNEALAEAVARANKEVGK